MTERDIFLAALELGDPAARAAYVAKACGDNAALRAEVEELLRTHDETSQFLETPAAATNAVIDKTVIGDSSIEDDDDDDRAPSSEAEFAKYLEPATRPGWIGRLGHYEIEEILGRGAFGIVAKAFDDKLHRVVAIKLMNPALAATSPPRKRFLREARTAAAVTHENIVAIYAVEEEPIPYLVMEYIPGQTLQQRMDANGPFDVAETLKLGRQIAFGLAAAHAANLIHRDIKPANILLTGGTNERAKISDFGLARAVDDASLTSSGLIAGTPMYMSPEQARGETLDHRTDLFSLGSVLYQMTSGRPPFRAANTIAVLKRVCEDRPRPLDDVIPETPAWLSTIIFRLMEKDPGNRYQSADEVAELLERCETELRHHGRVTKFFTLPETQLLQRERPSTATPRRNPLAWLIACVTVLVLLVGFVAMNRGKTTPEADKTNPVTKTVMPLPIEAAEQKPPVASGWQDSPADAPPVAAFALQFDGVDDYVALGDGIVVAPQEALTLEAWVWADRDAEQVAHQAIISLPPHHLGVREKGVGKWQHLVWANPLHSQSVASARSRQLKRPVKTDGLIHLASVWQETVAGHKLQLFLDGELINTFELTESLSLSEQVHPQAYLGAEHVREFVNPFAGVIDEVRISNIARYSADFLPEARFSSDDHTIALYHFDDGHGDVLIDASGNGHHGRIMGAKWVHADRSKDFPAGLSAVATMPDGGKWSAQYGWPGDAPKPAIASFDADQAKKHQEEWAAYLNVPVEYTNSVGMKFRLIPPGEFLMGSTPEEIEAALPIAGDDQTWQDCIRSEGPLHKVILTQPFFLATNEVTQSQFQQIMEANPSRFAASGEWADSVKGLDTGRFPVESVDWASARDFCQQLARREGLQPTASTVKGMRTPFGDEPYRLPAEAEWEFACRAGSTSQFSTGDTSADLSKVGWFDDNSSERTHATGELPANAFGLYDMHGNVWEWVLDSWQTDRYAARSGKAAVDPFDPMTKDSEPLTRGGNWSSYAEACRSASRCSASSAYNSSLIGFRVAMSVSAVKDLVAKKQSEAAKSASHTFPNWPADAPEPAVAPFDADQAKKHQEEWAAYLKVPVEYTNSIGMKFRLIPPGEFLMGGTPEEIAAALEADLSPFNGNVNWWSACLRSEGPRHRVRLTRPFYLGTHEVTQQQYQEIIGENPSENSPSGTNQERVAGLDTANFPVEFLSWHDAVQFCNRLNEREQRTNRHLTTMPPTLSDTGTGCRLPTEAEWEFACRAGTTSRYWTGHDVDSVLKAGWFQVNDGGRTHAVGELLANPFGLFDVHGNAWEWTADGWDESWYQQFADKLAVDPVCPLTDEPVAIMKTGTWPAFEHFCRAASRIPWACDARNSLQGMRVTLSVDAVREALKLTGSLHTGQETLADYYARNRRAAERALAVASDSSDVVVEIPQPFEWRRLAIGEVLPEEPFIVRQWSVKNSTEVSNQDLDVLEGLRHVLSLNLMAKSGLDAGCVSRIAAVRSPLKELGIGHINLKTSELAELPLMTHVHILWLSADQVDDEWRFLKKFPALRTLAIYGSPVPDLRLLRDVKHLRRLVVTTWGTAPDLAQIEEIQTGNPNLRVCLDMNQQHTPLGKDPAKAAVKRLLEAGIPVTGTLPDGTTVTLAIDDVDQKNATVYVVRSIPPEAILTDELRGLLTHVELQNIQAVGHHQADALAEILKDRQDLEILNLSNSDLTDAGLRSLQRLTGLRLVNLNGTKGTSVGIAAFHRAVPGCHLNTDAGDVPVDYMAVPEPQATTP